MKVEFLQGAPSSVEPLTHTQTSYVGTRALIRPQAGIALYNCLFARSIVSRRCGVGGVFMPWGKGLMMTLHGWFFSAGDTPPERLSFPRNLLSTKA